MRLTIHGYLAEDGSAVRKTMTAMMMVAALAGMPAPAFSQADAPTEAAMNFVAGFSDTHLTGMLQRIGARQEIMISLSTVSGELLVAVFEAEIAQAVKVHGPKWQENLARSWVPLLTEEELTSLTVEGAQSPYTEKYLELRAQAGQSMQALSGDLFKEVLSEVIAKTVKQIGDVQEDAAKEKPEAD